MEDYKEFYFWNVVAPQVDQIERGTRQDVMDGIARVLAESYPLETLQGYLANLNMHGEEVLQVNQLNGKIEIQTVRYLFETAIFLAGGHSDLA